MNELTREVQVNKIFCISHGGMEVSLYLCELYVGVLVYFNVQMEAWIFCPLKDSCHMLQSWLS